MIIFIERIISIFKGEKFKFDPKIPFSFVLYFLFTKGVRLLRGLLFYRRFIFLGKGTKIFASSQLLNSKNKVEIGEFCIINCLSHNGIELGNNFKLGDFSRVIVSGTIRNLGYGISFGDNVAIGEYSYIGGAGGVKVGDDCIIGQYFSIHPENHKYSGFGKLIRLQGVERKGVIIGDNCWIGAKVTICDGVSIGNNCVVAAGAVVTKSFSDGVVIGGNPAKIIKELYD